MIQPHLPIRLPCYDFTPIIEPTFGRAPLAVRLRTSGVPDSHGVTGGAQTHGGYHTLPENTRLERSLKKLYMDGGFILNTAGIIIEE